MAAHKTDHCQINYLHWPDDMKFLTYNSCNIHMFSLKPYTGHPQIKGQPGGLVIFYW